MLCHKPLHLFLWVVSDEQSAAGVVQCEGRKSPSLRKETTFGYPAEQSATFPGGKCIYPLHCKGFKTIDN